MSVHYLVYVSQAARGTTDATLAEIIAASQHNNPAAEITGVLLFVPGRDSQVGSFMQMLEGETAAVEALCKRIFADPRHHTMVVLARGDRETRCFPDWAMALKRAARGEVDDHPVLANLADTDFVDRLACGPGARDSVQLLRDFWDAAPLE
ncbi:BLUF domain-containing protein [Acidimangrovimonas sediminis]|uniref:BLUF domain-containing protein n=1 Tax=Acidimangrovimonas sediminis TaxID=2056283 RepID=UPI000C805D80|nr:BLUF domain-containing protein [Acidimangrovimonas sediminis]